MKHGVQMSTFAILGALVLGGTLCMGCSGPTGTATAPGASGAPGDSAIEGSTPAAVDPFAPGASVLCDVVSSPSGAPELEFYALSAMNHKLMQYPELSATIGLDSVSDCESARIFARGYRQYSAAHSGFDDDEPLAPMAADDAPMAELPPGKLESPKIFNGTKAKNNAVVQVFVDFPSTPIHESFLPIAPGKGGSCTGTFIAKNWILTAAHCISFTAITDCLKSGRPKQECEPKWDHQAEYTIFGTSGTAQTPYEISVVGRAYVHSNWLGRDPSANEDTCDAPAICHDHDIGDQNDLGLIYIQDDRVLPPNVEEDGAKRLSVIAPDTTVAPRFWGHGQPGDLIGPMRVGLRVNDPNLPLVYSVQSKYVEAKLPPSSPPGGVSYPCGGDSGGPLLRPGDSIKTNSGSIAIVESIIGVNASGPQDCQLRTNPNGAANVWRWTRVDVPVNRDWIHETLKRQPFQNGRERCTPRAFATGSPPVEQGFPITEECWGQPCSGDTCPGGYACSRPGRTLALSGSCEVCSGTSCDCIIGQCVPLGPP